jgi:hypothetical protein
VRAPSLAAELLKLPTVPAIRLSDLSAQEKRAVALADNRLSELGTWDPEMLSLELKELTADIGELTFDYITGNPIFAGGLAPPAIKPLPVGFFAGHHLLSSRRAKSRSNTC